MEISLRKPTKVVVYSAALKTILGEEVPQIYLQVAPVVSGRLLDTVTIRVHGAEEADEQVHLVGAFNAIAQQKDPYVWIREIASVGRVPICAVADSNVWEEFEEIQQEKVQKKAREYGLVFFVGGVLLGTVGGFLLGRRL